MDFCDFINSHPTIYHFCAGAVGLLEQAGFTLVSERELPRLERGKKYFFVRNSTALVACAVGSEFTPGLDGVATIATHIDANRVVLKPASVIDTKFDLCRLGVAPYGDGLNPSWWDRDLGIGGRVVIRKGNKVTTDLVLLPGIVASIPSLAVHFGKAALSHNKETNMIPIYGLESSHAHEELEKLENMMKEVPFARKHSALLVQAVANSLCCRPQDIVEWDLELFSAEKSKIGGLGHDLLWSSRMDDRLCAYAALKALTLSAPTKHSVQILALYDNEEVGSETKQGAAGNFLNVILDHVLNSLDATKDERARTLANSVLVSADVTHAANPNYGEAYLENSGPLLNCGVAVKRLGRFIGDGPTTQICRMISERAGQKLQQFAPRNDTASGSTIGPYLAAGTGMLTIDVGIPILSMHSIREVTGSLDPELGTSWFRAFYKYAEELIGLLP